MLFLISRLQASAISCSSFRRAPRTWGSMCVVEKKAS